MTSLVTNAAALNSTSFDSSIITVVLFSDPTFIPAPRYSDGGDDAGLSAGQIAGVVVGSVLGPLLLLGVCWVLVLIARRRHPSRVVAGISKEGDVALEPK